jgi:hypothetical protein
MLLSNSYEKSKPFHHFTVHHHATPKNEKKRQQDFFYLLDKLGVTYGRGTIPFRMLDKTNTKDKRHDTSN